MPKGPSGGMQMPNGFGGRSPGVNLPPNVQAMMQALMESKNTNMGPPPSSSPSSAPFSSPTSGLWQGGIIGNTPSQNSPTTPFAMPRPPDNLGMFGQAPGANRTWQNLPMPAARGTAVTNQPPVQ